MKYNKHVLDSMKDLSFWVIAADTCEVLYFNQCASKKIPSLTIGKKCPAVCKDTNCEDCFIHQMRQDKQSSAVIYDSSFGAAVDVTINETMWDDSIPALLVSIDDHYVFPREAQEIFGMPATNLSAEEIYPRIFSINLSDNIVKEITYFKFSNNGLLKNPSDYDDFIEYYKGLMHSEYKKHFITDFSKDNIISLFLRGIKVIDNDFYQLGNDGEYHWINFHFFITEGSTIDNIKAVAICMPIDTYKQQEFAVVKAELMAQKAILENIEIQQLMSQLREADHKTKLQNDVLQSLYDSVASGIAQISIADLSYISINKAGIEIYGITREEFDAIEHPTFDMFIYEEDLVTILGTLRTLTKVGDRIPYERRVLTPTGSIVWVKGEMQRVLDVHGNEIYQMVYNDFTKEKQNALRIEKERELYQIAAVNSADIIFEYDISTQTFTINETRRITPDGRTYQMVIPNYADSDFMKKTIPEEDLETAVNIFMRGNFSVPDIRIMNFNDITTPRWFTAQGAAIKRNGVPVRVIGSLRDIESFKHNEEEKLRLQKMFDFVIDNDYDHFCIINIKDKSYSFYSASGKEFKHSKQCQCENNDWRNCVGSDFLYEDDKDEFFKKTDFDYILKTLSSSKSSFTFTHRSIQNDYLRWKESRITYFDNKKYILYISRDIHQAFVEEEKKRQILSDALKAAESANDAKRSFLSHMSHDIRTPMNAIIGMTAIAVRAVKDEDCTRTMDSLVKIDTSAHFLLDLINNILDVSKIESGKLVLQKNEFSVYEFIDTINTLIVTQAKDKNINYIVTVSPELMKNYYGDKLRLNQIINNLLSNALKFTPVGGTVKLTVSIAKRLNSYDLIQFVVEDNGIGITDEFMERIFNPFEQENTMPIVSTGSGLGLAITKSLVTLMNGNITVQSKVNEGTRFVINIPLDIIKADEIDEAVDIVNPENNEYNTAASYSESKKISPVCPNGKILIVEDNELNMEIAKTLLEMEGHVVVTASNGKEAVELFAVCEPKCFRIILMDIRMPVMDGLEATKQIRKLPHPDAKTVPIYAMSANAFTEDVQRSLDSGMNGHLSKPINIAEVLEIVGKA